MSSSPAPRPSPVSHSHPSAGESAPTVSNREPHDTAIAFFLVLLLFGIYLLGFNGRITSSDGLSMFAVTDSFVKRGDLSTDQMWTFFGTKSAAAPDGEVYSKYGYGTSLFAAPLYLVALVYPSAGLMQITLLSSAFAIALTAGLVYLASRRLGYSSLVSVIVSLLFGLATPAFVYAKEFWSEPFAALALFAAFYFLLRGRDSAQTRNAIFAGLCLGLALAIRTTNVFLVPLYLLYGFLPRDLSWKQFQLRELFRKINWRALIAFSIPVVVFFVSMFIYNAIRFGNPLTTGYRPDEDFSNNILLGMYGLLFSPGKGLFVYVPFFAALPFGIWQFYKHSTRELVFISILFIVTLLLFSAWYYWWGGTNWAARFLVPTLPFLVLLCAPLVQLLLTPRASRFSLLGALSFSATRLLFLALVLLSLINELAGVAVNSLTYRLRLVNLSPNPDWDSIFSPALSPLLGHWQTLKPTNLDVAWMRATPDSMQIDELVIGATLILILWCSIRLVRMLLGFRTRLQRSLLALGLGIAVVIFSMYRYADDPRLGGNAGYAALLQTVERQSTVDDVLVLNDDAQARFFLNASLAPLKYYGLSRDPARWDPATQALFAKKLAAYARIWFAYDDRVDAPNPMRDWFAATLTETRRLEFRDGVTLVLYKPN